MSNTTWDKAYLGVLTIIIGAFVFLFFVEGDSTAQKVAQKIMVPVLSVILLGGVVLQKKLQKSKENDLTSQ